MDVEADAHELVLELQRLRMNAMQARRAMPAVAELLRSAVDDVYDAEGPGWEPLAAATLARRRGSVAKILQDTGVAAGSTQTAYGNDFAEARGGVPYLIFHVNGTEHMPRRDPFDLGPFERETIDEAERHILEQVIGG